MTTDLIAILHLFRIGSRFVPRTVSEVSEIMLIDKETAEDRITALRRIGFLRTEKAYDSAGLIRVYSLTDKGKAWMSVQPPKRGRRLTAVPK